MMTRMASTAPLTRTPPTIARYWLRDARGARGVTDEEENPGQHEQRLGEAESRWKGIAVLHRGRYHLVERQALVLTGEAVPSIRDAAAGHGQQHGGEEDAASCKEEEDLLPAPEALRAKDEQERERDVDQRSDENHPPLRGDAEDREGSQQVVAEVGPAALAGCRAKGRERNGDREGESEPCIEADPEEDEPHALAPPQDPAQERMECAADEHVVAAGARHRG